MAAISPLRYPGGKGKLAPFIKYILIKNGLRGGVYIEPYAGGAGVACSLLLSGLVRKVIINDVDKAIWAFWYSILTYTDELCTLIEKTPVNVAEWHRQKSIQENAYNVTSLELGFSTFFLNRTNVSGVLKGGIIGGLTQEGSYPIDARYNKENLIARIHAIAKEADKILLYNLDAMEFLDEIKPVLKNDSIIYFDPPYYLKGQGLYRNFYSEDDHSEIARRIKKLQTPWICSYDNVPEIRKEYKRIQRYIYDISYSAKHHYSGSEVIYFSHKLKIPEISSPLNIKGKDIKKLLKSINAEHV